MNESRVALVVGASRGLGLLIARELLGRGYAVAIAARNAEELSKAKDLLGGRVEAFPCDVRDADAVPRLVADVEAALGPIEVSIHVAGIISVGPAQSATLDLFDDAIETMLKGPIRLAWAVLPGMRERGTGRIGTVTSIGGIVAPPHLLPYAAAKFGAVGFSDGLAAELNGTGITATTIVPGLMRTGSHERAFFFGQQTKEYAWFAPAASLPLISMDADRAAKAMVAAVLAGRPLILLSWLTKVAVRVRGLAPATTIRLMGVAVRLLPQASPDQSDVIDGRTADVRLDSGLVRLLTTQGRKGARRNNQRGPGPDSPT